MDSNKILLALGGLLTLIQISPIKINPWSWLGSLIRGFIVGDLPDKLDTLTGKIDNLESKLQEEKAAAIRWRVLDFGNSCLQGRRHTKEEWAHCVAEIAVYEDYCERHQIKNGVMKQMCQYLLETDMEIKRKHEYL